MLTLHTKSFAVPAGFPAEPAPFGHGQLAMSFCQLQLPVKVLTALNGYYIGTQNEDGPVSRESVEYWTSKDHAQRALENGKWTQRSEP